jgi:single-strand DNA-binding protein
VSLPILSGTGRLIADPELRFTPSGTAVAKVRLAFNSRRKDDTGQWQDDKTFYVTGILFNDYAEHVAESLSKGDEVTVVGRLETRSWTDEKTDEKRSIVELLVDSIGPTLRYVTAKPRKLDRHHEAPAADAYANPYAPANADDMRSRQEPEPAF